MGGLAPIVESVVEAYEEVYDAPERIHAVLLESLVDEEHSQS